MKGKIITLMCASALLSSCHIYKTYDRPEDILTQGLYRDTAAVNDTLVSDTANFGNLPWREVFTDPQLQGYIEQALTSSPDIRTAALRVEEAKAPLIAAKLAFIPALTLSPQGTVSSWDKGKATQTYSLPVTASWQVDLFGQILNPKRQAEATLAQTKAYEQNTRVQLIANTANLYYTLLMLDRQLQITEGTAEILKKNTETMQAMQQQAEAIRLQLEQQGVKIDKIEVQLQNQGNNQQADSGWQNMQQHNTWAEQDARREELSRLRNLAMVRNSAGNKENTGLAHSMQDTEQTAIYATRRLNVVA